MKKRHLLMSLLVLGVGSLWGAAQSRSVVEHSTMLNLLESGQLVGVKKMSVGYAIHIHASSRGGRADSKQARISSVQPDHIILRYADGHEQHVAARAIVEITRYALNQNRKTESSKSDPVLAVKDERKERPATRPSLDLDAGYVETGMNEVSIVSTVDDPPGLRLGVKREREWGRSLGKLSFNSVRQDGVQDECVLIQGKLDERFPPTDLVGEYTFYLRTRPGSGDEGDMVRVLTLQHDRIVAHVPVVFESGDQQVGTPGN